MSTTSILQRKPQFQWDADSAPCRSSNCRPTVTAQIIGFYHDVHYSPRYIRHMMQGGDWCGGTATNEATVAYSKLGVPAVIHAYTPDQVRAVLAKGIPMDLAVSYGYIPRDYRYIDDMGFYGLHSVLAAKVMYKNGVRGLAIRDPDHGSTTRPSRPNYTFWPDAIWQKAFLQGRSQGIVVHPRAPKKVAAPTVTGTRKSLAVTVKVTHLTYARWHPGLSHNAIRTLKAGTVIKTKLVESNGGAYMGPDGKRHTSWYAFVSSGNTVWFPAAFADRT